MNNDVLLFLRHGVHVRRSVRGTSMHACSTGAELRSASMCWTTLLSPSLSVCLSVLLLLVARRVGDQCSCCLLATTVAARRLPLDNSIPYNSAALVRRPTQIRLVIVDVIAGRRHCALLGIMRHQPASCAFCRLVSCDYAFILLQSIVYSFRFSTHSLYWQHMDDCCLSRMRADIGTG